MRSLKRNLRGRCQIPPDRINPVQIYDRRLGDPQKIRSQHILQLIQLFPCFKYFCFRMRQHLRAFRFKKQDPVCFQIILGVVLIQYDLTGAFDLLRQQLLKLHDLRCQLPAMEHDFFFRCFRIYFHSYLHLTTSCCCHYTVSKINVNAFSVSGRNTQVSGRK